MSDPRRIPEGRLLDDGATPFERDLLESWSSEQPSSAARARALALAGVAAGTLAAATAATTAGATANLGAAAAAPKAAGLGLALVVKWGFLFVVVTAGAIAGVAVLGRKTADDGATRAATTPVVAPAPPPAAVGTTPAVEPKTVSLADLPPAPATDIATAPTGASTAAVVAARPHGATGTPTEPSISDEIAAFDRARAALDAGDSDRALALVDVYEKRFPSGTFVQEAEVLRVQALSRKGDSSGARRVGQRFLAAHPTSPHAARVRAILDTSSP